MGRILAFDPHVDHNPNFREEEYEAYKKNQNFLLYAKEIQSILDQGLVAAVPMISLWEIGFYVRARMNDSHVLLQGHLHHWVALGICRMIHGYFEEYEDQSTIKFYRSPVDGPPMYPPYIKFLPPEIGRAHGRAVLKTKEDEDETIRATRNRKNLKTFSVSREGIRERHESLQYSLFDLHESSEAGGS